MTREDYNQLALTTLKSKKYPLFSSMLISVSEASLKLLKLKSGLQCPFV